MEAAENTLQIILQRATDNTGDATCHSKGRNNSQLYQELNHPRAFLTRTMALLLLHLPKIKIFEGLNMLTVETHSLLSASAVRAALALWEGVTFKEEIGLEEDRLVK